jgi:hypothetical protein
MAIRIHVTAVRDSDPEHVRAVFTRRLGEGFGQVGLCERDEWVSFTTSVWGVAGSDLNAGLCELGRAGLQFTTSDGDRWYLTVHGGGSGPAHFLHEFHIHSSLANPEYEAGWAEELEEGAPLPVDPALAFLEEDPAPPAGDTRPRTAFDRLAEELASMGAVIPEEVRSSVAGLSLTDAVNLYREWHAEQVVAALAAAGIPHDAAALRAILLWENVSEGERDSDLGNLPRLLAALRLGGEWDAWVHQAENPPAPVEEAAQVPEAEPPPDYLGWVARCVDALPLVPVVGGPVPLPLRHLARVAFFADACATSDQDPSVRIRVQLPPEFTQTLVAPPPSAAQGQVAVTAGGFEAGLLNSFCLHRVHLERILGRRLAHLLFHLPDGAALECAFAAEDQPATHQRYRGHVASAVWWIDATCPPLSRDVLSDALELAAAQGRTVHRARDAAEVQAIMEAVARDGYLHNMGVKRRGRTLRCEYDHGHLAQLFFRRRFRQPWDFAPVEAERDRQFRERRDQERRLRKMLVARAREQAAPHAEEVLLRGRHSRYWASDFTRLTELEPEMRAKFDATLTARGFQHLGDLVVQKQRDVVLRVFAREDRLCYGILMGKRALYLGYELFSRFADGSTLTTTTNPMVQSHPEAGIYYQSRPGLDLPALYEKHCWGMARFRTRKGTEPELLAHNLLGVAQEIDQAFARRATVAD